MTKRISMSRTLGEDLGPALSGAFRYGAQERPVVLTPRRLAAHTSRARGAVCGRPFRTREGRPQDQGDRLRPRGPQSFARGKIKLLTPDAMAGARKHQSIAEGLANRPSRFDQSGMNIGWSISVIARSAATKQSRVRRAPDDPLDGFSPGSLTRGSLAMTGTSRLEFISR